MMHTLVTKHRRKGALFLPALVLVLVALAARWWLPLFAVFLIVEDPMPSQPADAIVPLAGGVERIEYAADLYEQGVAEWFVTTNMPLEAPGIRTPYSALAAREAVWQEVPHQDIIQITTVISTTYQEVHVLRQLAEQREWRSLVVVTSPSHTRRARMMLHHIFAGQDIQITVRPVADHWYTPDTWWTRQDGLRETTNEYIKLVVYALGYHAGYSPPPLQTR